MSFVKSTTLVAVIGFALSGASAFAQSSGADAGINRDGATSAGQKGSMMKSGNAMTGRSSSDGTTALGTGNDRTTATGGNAGGRADKN